MCVQILWQCQKAVITIVQFAFFNILYSKFHFVSTFFICSNFFVENWLLCCDLICKWVTCRGGYKRFWKSALQLIVVFHFRKVTIGKVLPAQFRKSYFEKVTVGKVKSWLYPDTGDQCSQLIVATLVPSTPICLFFNLVKLQCKQTVVTDFCIGFVNKIHIIGKGMIKETWIAKIKEIGC